MIVITLSKVPYSLRGDLTKWFQEIQTGVYVGNLNARVRDNLWERIQNNIGHDGEATMVYSTNNEFGYTFKTTRKDKEIVDFDGIPFVKHLVDEKIKINFGFSNASKRHKARIMQQIKRPNSKKDSQKEYVAIDIETTGLNISDDVIISVAAVKGRSGESFYRLIKTNHVLTPKIVELTGITPNILNNEGANAKEVLSDFKKFISKDTIVGFNVLNFDLKFLNIAMAAEGIDPIDNVVVDLLQLSRKVNSFLDNYRFDTVLKSFDIVNNRPHNALSDAISCKDLAQKLIENGKLSF